MLGGFTRERLGPSHINGFLSNLNEVELARSWNYNLGWNQRIGRKSFVLTTVFSRDREIPHEEVIPASECLPCNQSGHVRPVLFEGELYGAGVVWNQFIHHQVTLVTDYDFTQEENLFSLHWEHEGSAGLC